MTIGIRILSALPVAAFATVALLFNLGAFAGGAMTLPVVDPSRLSFAYWFSGTGCFLTTTIVMVWLQSPRRENNNSLRARLSAAWVTRAIAVFMLVTPPWIMSGAYYVKNSVISHRLSGEPAAIDAANKTAAAAHEKRYAIYPQSGEDARLIIRKNCADAVIAELQAAGLTVKGSPPLYED